MNLFPSWAFASLFGPRPLWPGPPRPLRPAFARARAHWAGPPSAARSSAPCTDDVSARALALASARAPRGGQPPATPGGGAPSRPRSTPSKHLDSPPRSIQLATPLAPFLLPRSASAGGGARHRKAAAPPLPCTLPFASAADSSRLCLRLKLRHPTRTSSAAIVKVRAQIGPSPSSPANAPPRLA